MGDRVLEPDETFQVQLSSPLGATISDGISVVTILNDEKPLTTAVASNSTDAPVLTMDQAAPILAAAIQLWEQAGAATSSFDEVELIVMDLPDTVIGLTEGSTILIDATAAGYGWFVDATPFDSREYHETGDGLLAFSTSDAFGRMDLLTLIAHELGHVLGYEHTESGLMSEDLAPGARNLESANGKLTFIDLPLDTDSEVALAKKRRTLFSR
jgi:hypothetical protein